MIKYCRRIYSLEKCTTEKQISFYLNAPLNTHARKMPGRPLNLFNVSITNNGYNYKENFFFFHEKK